MADRAAKRSNTDGSQEGTAAGQGIFAQMQQSLAERGAMLGGVQETFNHLEQASSEWFAGMSKSVESQKKKALFSAVGGKLNPF